MFIAQTQNVEVTVKPPVSTQVFAYALSLALFVLAFAPLVGRISVAALAGTMIAVSYSTVQWRPTALALRNALNGRDIAKLGVLALTALLCYEADFATGIAAGVAADRLLAAPRGDGDAT